MSPVGRETGRQGSMSGMKNVILDLRLSIAV